MQSYDLKKISLLFTITRFFLIYWSSMSFWLVFFFITYLNYAFHIFGGPKSSAGKIPLHLTLKCTGFVKFNPIRSSGFIHFIACLYRSLYTLHITLQLTTETKFYYNNESKSIVYVTSQPPHVCLHF